MAGSLWVQRRFCVYELLLTKEKFYEGMKGLCLHEDGYRSSGMDRASIPWIVLSYHGSRGRPSPSGLALGRCHGCVHDIFIFMIGGHKLDMIRIQYEIRSVLLNSITTLEIKDNNIYIKKIISL